MARIIRAPLPSHHVTAVEGVPVTTLDRTVNDIARTSSLPDALMVADAVLRNGLPLRLLRKAVDDAARWPGNARARTVADLADARAESPWESRCRAALWVASIDGFVPQVAVHDAWGGFVARVDLGHAGLHLALEFDGAAKYDDLLRPGRRPAEAVRHERERDRALADAGWHVEHRTSRDVRDQARFEEVVLAAMQRAARHRTLIA